MTAHPNRSKASPSKSRNPKPAEIKALQEKHQLTGEQCAELLHTSDRAYRQWIAGERRMHPAFWELFQLKAAALGA